MIGAEELSVISSYQTLSGDKSKKVMKRKHHVLILINVCSLIKKRRHEPIICQHNPPFHHHRMVHLLLLSLSVCIVYVGQNDYVFVRMTPSPSPTELQGWFGKRPDFSYLST
jgi:hypothetical protein